MGIRIIKERETKDYTFIDDGLNLRKSGEQKKPNLKKDQVERNFRLKDGSTTNKLKKSKISGGHSMQGHSPVYE